MVANSFTLEPDSAVPLILGESSADPEPGSESFTVGGTGALESSTYVADDDEHGDSLPASSVAVALSVVVVSLSTATGIPGDAKSAAEPLAAGSPEQSLVSNRFTVDPDWAEPFTFGALSLDPDAGTVAASTVGAVGGVESSTYGIEFEQSDRLPAASTVFAERLVVSSAVTETVIPVPVKAATVSVADAPPEQSALLKISTWVGEPAPVVPFTFGDPSLDGEAGVVAVIVGAAGGVASTWNDRVAVAELPAASVAFTRNV